jgi:hypothetical protein
MAASNRLTRTTLVLATGATLLAVASTAEAQRRQPRIGVAAPAQPEPRQTDPRLPPGTYITNGPQRRPGHWDDGRPRDPRHRAPTVVYVPVPVDGYYGYGYGSYSGYGSYVARPFGGVTDANGRPLASGYDAAPSTGGAGYTPDLGGSPYAVTDEGMMVVDLPSGERRAFPSCAAAEDQRDPQGRPRTIFYQSQDYWMILRPGQRGRVHGEPPTGTAACYAIDRVGRVVLRY